MEELKVKYDEYVPLRDIVFRTLREAIITGKLKPGERLMEIKLANELGVSRTPVREAIRKLELEGMVIMHARKGAVVAPINGKDLREILEIRKALESLAVHLASRKTTSEKIAKLRELNGKLADAATVNDIDKIAQYDVEFHDYINEISENEHLNEILRQLKEHLFRYRLEFIRNMKNRQTLSEEHNRIIDAIESQNIRVACREIEKHIEIQERYILSTLLEENETI